MKRKISYEKLFVFINIIVIFVIICIYLFRAIYYYKKTNYIPETQDLYSTVVNLKNITNRGDGLYESGESYYFKGKDVNNYVLYSDILWRIVELDQNKIKLVSDSNLTSLVYGIDSNYENSYIYKLLNSENFIRGLYLSDENLVKLDWCNESVDINNYACGKKVNALVGLISTEDYIKSGKENSYLNNETYWWTINTSSDNNAYYIEPDGQISIKDKNIDTYTSYGVRPSINLKSDISFIGGTGTKENPYKIENNLDIDINNHSVGTYVKYNGYNWIIMEISDNYTKVILDGYLLDDSNEPVKIEFNKVRDYLEKDFLSKFNLDELEKTNYYYGKYDSTNNYNLNFKDKEFNSYVGIPVVGDMHISDYTNVWLNNEMTSDEKLNYVSTDVGTIYADFSSSKNYVRPIICIKKGLIISEGEGTKTNPLVVGDANETKIEN